MDKLLQGFLISITIAVPAIIGLFRYRKIDKRYRPFIWICCTFTFSELLRFALINVKIYTFATYNIALPVVLVMYLILFKRWSLFAGKKYLLPFLFMLILIIWIADHFLINGFRLHTRTSYFRIFNSLLLVMLAVNMVNHLIISEKNGLLMNSRFLLCIGLIIYYTYRISFDAFTLKGMSEHFLLQLGDFNRYLLVGLNVIFTLAMLWIPSKKNFTMQF